MASRARGSETNRVKIGPKPVDIRKMEPATCPTCGADIVLTNARFCSECGTSIRDGTPEPTVYEPKRLSDGQWQIITWAAVGIAAAAVAVIIMVALQGTPGVDRAPSIASGAPTTVPTEASTEALKAIEIIDTPVMETVVIESPRLGPSTRYHRSGAVVVARLTMDECGRHDGMLVASGTIRNDSSLDQTFTYGLTVDIVRDRLGTRLARLPAVVERLGPGEIAAWNVETPSTKIVTIRCDVDQMTVEPLTFP